MGIYRFTVYACFIDNVDIDRLKVFIFTKGSLP